MKTVSRKPKSLHLAAKSSVWAQWAYLFMRKVTFFQRDVQGQAQKHQLRVEGRKETIHSP